MFNLKFLRLLCQRRLTITISLTLFAIIYCSTGYIPVYAFQKNPSQKKINKPSNKTAISVKRRKAISPRSNTRNVDVEFPVSLGDINREERPGIYENPNARLNWFLFQRTYPGNTIPVRKRARAFSFLMDNFAVNAFRISSDVNVPIWISRGPTPIASDSDTMGTTSGRINALAISPANPQIILVGGATGGIWRSTDGGNNFKPVTDDQSDLAVGAIAFSQSNPQIVYAGMGDPTGGYMGTGILKSTDAGQTWIKVSDNTLPAPGTTSDILVDRLNPDKIYIAQYSYRDTQTAKTIGSGFFRSTDGGISWRRTKEGLPKDLAFHPTNYQTLYMAMTTTYADQKPSAGVYRSQNSGESWTPIYTPPYLDAANVKIAVSQAEPETIYVYTGESVDKKFFSELIVSRDGGKNWTNLNLLNIDTDQFDYNCYIAADPFNAKVLYLGSRDLFKTTDGGMNWTNLTNNWSLQNGEWDFSPKKASSHTDQHTIAISPADSNKIFIANDGGISRSNDGGKNFVSLNNTLSLSLLNSVSVHPGNSAVSCSGSQDNGALVRTGNSQEWREFITGDSGGCFINIVGGEEYYYTSYISGKLVRFRGKQQVREKDIGTNQIFEETGDSPRIGFYPAFALNRANGNLYFGSWKLFTSSNNGDTWTKPGGDQDLTEGDEDKDVLTTIAFGPPKTEVIYTGSAMGRVMISKNGGKNWSDITADLPDRFIKSIVVDSIDSNIAYLTVSGFNSGHVFKTVNGGGLWKNISGNLPDIPVNALLVDPNNSKIIYIGTDLGVFRSVNEGIWQHFGNGMPPVIVTGFSSEFGAIQVSTYGRGVFELRK